MSHGLGVVAAREYIVRGDAILLNQLIDDANARDPALKQRAYAALSAVVEIFARTLQCAADGGKVRFSGERLPGVEESLYTVTAGPERWSRTLKLQTNAIAGVRAKVPGYLAGFVISSRQATKETPAPTPVSVVSLPARKTTTEIERNGAGEIIGSLQVEKDF